MAQAGKFDIFQKLTRHVIMIVVSNRSFRRKKHSSSQMRTVLVFLFRIVPDNPKNFLGFKVHRRFERLAASGYFYLWIVGY